MFAYRLCLSCKKGNLPWPFLLHCRSPFMAIDCAMLRRSQRPKYARHCQLRKKPWICWAMGICARLHQTHVATSPNNKRQDYSSVQCMYSERRTQSSPTCSQILQRVALTTPLPPCVGHELYWNVACKSVLVVASSAPTGSTQYLLVVSGCCSTLLFFLHFRLKWEETAAGAY